MPARRGPRLLAPGGWEHPEPETKKRCRNPKERTCRVRFKISDKYQDVRLARNLPGSVINPLAEEAEILSARGASLFRQGLALYTSTTVV